MSEIKKQYKRVIDADNNKILEFFDIEKTEEKLNEYLKTGYYKDISVDRDGDIILWRED